MGEKVSHDGFYSLSDDKSLGAHLSLFFLLRFPLFLEIDSVVSPTLPTLITCSIHSATSIISIKLVDSFSNK